MPALLQRLPSLLLSPSGSDLKRSKPQPVSTRWGLEREASKSDPVLPPTPPATPGSVGHEAGLAYGRLTLRLRLAHSNVYSLLVCRLEHFKSLQRDLKGPRKNCGSCQRVPEGQDGMLAQGSRPTEAADGCPLLGAATAVAVAGNSTVYPPQASCLRSHRL